MTKKPLKLLIVEDKERHLVDAKAYFSSLEQNGLVNPVYASTLVEAERHYKKRLDGIISDIFFPIGADPKVTEERIEGLAWRLSGYKDGSPTFVGEETDHPPAGVYVIEHAMKKGIPAVLITDAYHHGPRVEPVNSWVDEQGLPKIVDNDNVKDMPKHWRTAYAAVVIELCKERLTDFFERQNQKRHPKSEKLADWEHRLIRHYASRQMTGRPHAGAFDKEAVAVLEEIRLRYGI